MRSMRMKTGSPSDRRNHTRTHVLFSGQLFSGDRTASGILFDLSAGGARMRLAEPLEANSAITLRLAKKLDFHVEIAWRDGQMFGFTENYIKVQATYVASLANTIAPVTIETINSEGVCEEATVLEAVV